ncbi:hypothetical protein KVQ82_12350 [Pseudomonas sp. AO-1]|uniref:hypothetical protein n=1 Tax=Pseudomonas sp. AO-1 TaxID=2855434 RepID=UPI001C766E37|nr:hypothetical protein [Pseudomonas sp. AO-1]QXZ16652.1 hypothetical protein KVQ82_12350 [Pseudomonas sp. AO-1]
MTYPLNGNYDGGSGNIYLLVIDKFDEPAGTWSGYFHDTRTNKWENVKGGYQFYGDGQDETVLEFRTSHGAWRWEADYVGGSPSFKKWSATLNGAIYTPIEFFKESNTPKTPTLAELKYGE